MPQNDFQELINHCCHLAEKLLIDQNGEFYPFGAKINDRGEVINLGYYEGEENPLSATMIDELKKHLDNEISGCKLRAYAIAFDCRVTKDSNSEKMDAIAIECYSANQKTRIVYFFPYKFLNGDRIEFGDSWGELVDSE